MPMRFNLTSRLTGLSLILVTLVGIVLAAQSIIRSIDLQEFLGYAPSLMKGAAMTLFLAGVSSVSGFGLALVLLVLSFANQNITRAIHAYQILIRSTPLLAQLYLVYYGAGAIAPLLRDLGLWWIFKDAVLCVLIVFLINTTAYQSFILIGCVANIPRGQREAGLSLGLTSRPLIMRILLPQALRVAIRPLGNELVGMIKASSVASVITVYDLLGTTQVIYSETFNLAYLPLAASVYIVMVECVRLATDRVSKHFEIATHPVS